MRPLTLLPLAAAAALAGSLAVPSAALAVQPPAAGGALRVAMAEAAAPEAVLRLAERLRRLEEDGLDPRHYDLPPAALAATDAAAFRAAIFRAATAALQDLLHGRVGELRNRVDLRRDTVAHPLGPWLAELASAAEPAAVVERAATLHPEAPVLRRELARMRARAAAGGYASIPPLARAGDTIEPGAADAQRVPALRARLAGYDPLLVAGASAASPHYDPALVEAVKRFQTEEGIEADGRIGRITMTALNRPVEARIRQIRVALDIRRGRGPALTERRIEVNVPDYRLRLYEEGATRPALDMAVVVGRPDRPTPMLTVRLTAVMFNPPWGVPERNAREDLLPRLRRDPRAVAGKGFRIFAVQDGERVEIDPTTVDWHSVSTSRFPYVIRQDAGDANALGRIKFVMPNTEDIFMHDTPDRHLFRRPDRAFSSGCIRLERPMELLEAALSGTAGWDRTRADRALAVRTTSSVQVARSIPVRLHYTTVIVEGGNRVRIRPDIYGLDEAYARALDAATPARHRLAASAGAAAAAPMAGR